MDRSAKQSTMVLMLFTAVFGVLLYLDPAMDAVAHHGTQIFAAAQSANSLQNICDENQRALAGGFNAY